MVAAIFILLPVLAPNVLLFHPCASVALVFGRLYLAMGLNICAQKGSCRWKRDKCALLLSDCCVACSETFEHSMSYLSNHRELWYGVCLRLPQADGSDPTQPAEPLSTQLAWPTRQRMKTDRFVDGALPSKSKMECDRLGKPAYLDMATTHAIRLDLDNPAIDRAIAARYQAI